MYCLNLPYLRCTDGGIHVHAVHIFSSSSRRQQQERQGPPGVFLLWLHSLLCWTGTDRSGDAHFQGCSTRPPVFGACLSRNTNHVGFDQRRNFRVVQVSLKYFHFSFLFLFCLCLFRISKWRILGSSLYIHVFKASLSLCNRSSVNLA